VRRVVGAQAQGTAVRRAGQEPDRDVQVLAHAQTAAAQRGEAALVGGAPPRVGRAGDDGIRLPAVGRLDQRAVGRDDGVVRLVARHEADARLQRRVGDRRVVALGERLDGVRDHPCIVPVLPDSSVSAVTKPKGDCPL
jgi:hypothetical protein